MRTIPIAVIEFECSFNLYRSLIDKGVEYFKKKNSEILTPKVLRGGFLEENLIINFYFLCGISMFAPHQHYKNGPCVSKRGWPLTETKPAYALMSDLLAFNTIANKFLLFISTGFMVFHHSRLNGLR